MKKFPVDDPVSAFSKFLGRHMFGLIAQDEEEEEKEFMGFDF